MVYAILCLMESRKKILFVITKGNWGGAQKYVFDLATGLPKDKIDSAVAFGEGSILGQKLIEAGVRIIKLAHSKRDINRSDIQLFWELWKLFRNEKPDIIHLNSSMVGLLGVLAGRLAGIPKIIFTAHGWASAEGRPFYQRIMIKSLHWLSIIFSHAVIAVSEETARYFANWPLAGRKIIVREAARTKIARMAPELTAKTSDAYFWIGTIGELHKNKGLDSIIRAMVMIPHSNAIFLAIGEGEEREQLKDMIKQFKIEDKAFLAGQIAKAAELLKAFDLFVLPSRKEGLPYVLLEAGLAELPVLASAVGGIPEVIKTMRNGVLIDASEPKNISAAISLLYIDRQKSADLGRRLRQTVVERFSTEKMMADTLRVYNE